VTAGANLYFQKETDRKFKSLIKLVSKEGGPSAGAEASTVPQGVLGAATATTRLPSLKKEMDNKVATFSAQAVLLGNLNSGEIFASKGARRLLPIASLTKIMTALVVRDELSLSENIIVPPACSQLPENQQQLGLKAGRVYKVEDLLYGLLVRSGADCACALASGFGGEDTLVESMNQKAKKLGLGSTHFQNAVGNDALDNFSSASDLFILAGEFMKDPVLRKIAGTTYFWGMQNTNELLFDLEGITGVKTGYTPGAGECLVTSWVKGKSEYIGIVLGSNYRFKELGKLVQLSKLIP